MKVHLRQWADVAPGYRQIARDQWEQEGLLLDYVRTCDQLMVKTKNAASLTSDRSAVTCKHCLKAMSKR